MPPLKTYRIFISHAWIYNDSYYSLIDMLNKASNFSWINYSVPEHDPLIIKSKTKKELYDKLTNQIQPTHTVIILAGMYANYREWIEKEVEIAINFNKPMIGIIPRGNEKTPVYVQNAVKTMVNWNTNSIVEAIREYSI